jgi:c-di-AMP phosphodiesterase-like protein
MKKLSVFLILFFTAFYAFAQKYVPQIKAGTILTYKAESRNTGSSAAVTLTVINLGDPVKIKWEIPFVGKGFYTMHAKSIQNASQTIAKEPDPDIITELDTNQTLILLSKDAYKSMTDNKTFVLNGYTFNVQPDTSTFTINNKVARVTFATTQRGHREIWILDNPDFPIICKAHKVTPYIDFWLTEIKE